MQGFIPDSSKVQKIDRRKIQNISPSESIFPKCIEIASQACKYLILQAFLKL